MIFLKKYIKTTFLLILFASSPFLCYAQSNDWPVLKTYEGEYLKKIAMPIGGIGTGTVALNGRGALQDWEIMNRPMKGFNPSLIKGPPVNRTPFFSVYIKEKDKNGQVVLLEGPISDLEYESDLGASASNHGLPRFTKAVFKTAYPFGQVKLTDTELPVEVTVGAFNPLIPGKVDESSIPMAVLSYRVKNTSASPVEIAIAGTIQNFIGTDGFKGKPKKNVISFRDDNDIKGLYYTSKGVDKKSHQWGTMSLVSLNEGKTTYRTNWIPVKWGDATLDFWDDFSADGLLENRENTITDAPTGTLATKIELKAGEEKELKFLITWHFPNRPTWPQPGFHKKIEGIVGNYYATKYSDAWDVAVKTAPKLTTLENETKTFVNTFLQSDIPQITKEAALFNLAHLRTQLAFRTETGHLLGWEGNFNNRGAGFGSCTHVWNYEQVTPFLFGELAQTMRDVEFGYGTADNGLMSFRFYLPLEHAQEHGIAAADGQMGAIMKFYREWQLSGEDTFLKKHWPMVKKALAFCWIKGGWDANKDGIMEGSQHNTMDVEYFGPNPQMGFWYLGALKSAEKMAKYLGDKSFAKTCKNLYDNGSKWMDKNLFNGEYYQQDIQPPMVAENVAPGLMLGIGAKDLTSPDYQLGKGVLVDQLVGQVLAHILDLGYLTDKENIKETNKAIIKYNYREDLSKHPNFMRSYALGDESALLMASYPEERPAKPFPYFTEVMTGFEYTAAVSMLYENQNTIGLKTMQDVRDRYDGKKRNPFNEAEFGNHYARAMMAWGSVLAYTGFNYSAVNQSMKFNSKNGSYFWSNGYQYGNIEIIREGKTKKVALTLLNGSLELKSFELKQFGAVNFKKGKTFAQDETLKFTIKNNIK
ncbi:GH116 family glycosyl-hydrolase [uncultured Polaribacter sp.]|uniref:GH116 family glycosyl-hydrolase n=1 Tax=uncultured Polaribacter sp. TaxID=174711 RepID=UPI00262C836E|nr:GH116 family glycosyl-hydrolase [uncultured Polaribacter sp.]